VQISFEYSEISFIASDIWLEGTGFLNNPTPFGIDVKSVTIVIWFALLLFQNGDEREGRPLRRVETEVTEDGW
jgi:hypothetical protein